MTVGKDSGIPPGTLPRERSCVGGDSRAFCNALREALNDPESDEAKGLTILHGWAMHDDQKSSPRYLGVSYRKRARAAGTILNYCPWCGVRIRVEWNQ